MGRETGLTAGRRAIQAIVGSPMAILPEWLESMAGLATTFGGTGTEPTPAELRDLIRGSLAELTAEHGPFQSIAAEMGEPLGPGSRARLVTAGGVPVAVIPVVGPLFHYADEIHDVCGCSSYQQILSDVALVREARAAGRVSAVMFDHDSPGGMVDGCAECADEIAALAAEVPAASYSRAMMCSASYWLGTAVGAGNVYSAKVALLGSIGVAAAYRVGGNSCVVEIVSSQSPNKRPDVSTDKGRAQRQAMVDDMATIFIEAVSAWRGVAVETVLADFGQGDVFVGRKAVTAGLADGVASFEGALSILAERGAAAFPSTAAGGYTFTHRTLMAQQPTAGADVQPAPLTADQVRQQQPAAATEIANGAATAERTRIKGILACATNDEERTAVAPLIDDPQANDGDAAKAILAAAREKGTASGARAAAYRAALGEDERQLDAPDANADAAAIDAEDARVQAILTAGRPPTPSKN